MTDDDEDMSADTFVTLLQALGSEHFGSDPANPSFVFHSIIGIKEKADRTAADLPTEPLEAAVCTSNQNDVANAGSAYQELSIRTGGLRFPLCQFTATSRFPKFRTIGRSSSTTSRSRTAREPRRVER